MSYHYDPVQALEELNDEVILPNPVYVRDMIFRSKLPAEAALEIDRDFEVYLKQFGELQTRAQRILERLVERTAQR